MKLISLLLSTSRRQVALTLVCGVLSGVGSAAVLGIINQVLIQPGTQGLGTFALPFAGAMVVALLARICSQMLLNRLQQGTLRELRLRLTRHLITTSYRQLEEAGTHRVLNSISGDLMNISIGVIHLPEVFINLATVVGTLCYLAWLSWPMFLGLVFFIVVGFFTYSVPASVGFRMQMGARQKGDQLFKHFIALINGAKELRLNRERREDFITHEVKPLVTQVERETVRGDDLVAAAGSWGMFLYSAVIGLLLFLLPLLVDVSITMLLGSVLVVLYIQQPLTGLISAMPFLGRASFAIEQVEKLGMELVPDEPKRAEEDAPLPSVERIELVGVTHTYRRENEDETFTLGPLHLALNRGELVFLVGGNGSGKTTLAKLLTGLYAPESGELRVNGQPIPRELRDAYRQSFSAVFFDFFLFERLLGAGSPELMKQAQDYLGKLHLDKKVRIQDGALSTLELSQGQRKRLALLMAYLEDRPVYIFDEWAADQDPTFKELFYREFLPELKRRGKAVLVISHDDRYFQLADRVVHLESGRITSDTRPPAAERLGA